MRILIPLLSLGKSGGLKVLTNLANNWSKMGIDTTIVVTNNLIEQYYDIQCNLIFLDDAGNVNKYSSNKHIPLYRQLYLMYKYMRQVSLEYDCVIANYNLTTYPIFLGSKSNNFYYIQAYEPEFYDEIKNNILKKYVQKVLAWFSYFLPFTRIVNSNMYINYKNIKTNYVVYPGIDLEIYFPKERSKKNNSDKFVIGCIGRKEEWKGSEDVAEAIKLLHHKGYENIEFVVAFNAVSYKNHTLVYPDGDKKLADFYRSLDILVTPGHIQLEAIHYPVIEAMATKTPLITTGYFPSNENNSFLVPIKSPEDIARNIVYAINNYEIAIAKANIAYSQIQEFSWKNISDKFLNIIRKE